MGRGGDIYGYDRSGLDETFLIEGPEKPDGTRKGGLNILWSTSPVIDRKSVDMELRERDVRIDRLERELAHATRFLRHMSAHWKPIEPEIRRESIILSWDPAKMGLKWPP